MRDWGSPANALRATSSCGRAARSGYTGAFAETQPTMPRKIIRIQYDCTKCPGYCCSYPRIEVTRTDLRRLARHFGIDADEAARRFTREYKSDEGSEQVLRHQKDEIYGSVCRFFDTDARRCTVYAARPAVCRQYPDGKKCGYYDFLKFERKHQDDPDFIPSA